MDGRKWQKWTNNWGRSHVGSIYIELSKDLLIAVYVSILKLLTVAV